MIQQGRPKQLVDQLSPHRCQEWHSDQTSASNCLRLRLMPSLGGEHPSKMQKSEEVQKDKANPGPKLDSVRAPARGSKATKVINVFMYFF
jgi:hypothetical protein